MVGNLSFKKDAAFYRVKSTVRELDGHPYRFVVVSSSSLDKRKEKAIAREIKEEEKELSKACRELSKRSFFCEADARKALEIFAAENANPYFSLTGEIVQEQVFKRRVGRPRKDEVPESDTIFRVIPSLGELDEQAVKALKAKAGTFVLITSILDEKELSSQDVLREYKEQTVAEVSFRFLKDPMYVDGIYLKNTERVVALGYVFLMALLVYALLQRRGRLNLAKEKEPLVIPGNRKTYTPTGSMLLQMLEPIKVVKFVTENGVKRQLSQKQLTANVLRLLRLAGFSESIYYAVKRIPGYYVD